MLRQLFALLLLLTGLAALGQPAQARTYEASGTGLTAAACEYASPARADPASALLAAPARPVGSRNAAPASPAAASTPVPAVIVQADRAHE